MRKVILSSILFLTCAFGLAQQLDDREEFEYNRHLAKNTKSYTPKDGFVPNKATATAIAYAIALPIYGKTELDRELPLRAETQRWHLDRSWLTELQFVRWRHRGHAN